MINMKYEREGVATLTNLVFTFGPVVHKEGHI